MRDETSDDRREVKLPAPTVSPMIMAFGLTLVAAGLVTTAGVTVVGAVLALFGAVGWWGNVLPSEREESVPAGVPTAPVTARATDAASGERQHRLRIPVEIHPYRSGVRGGLVGAVAMAIVALAWGLFSGSIWLPVNLLAAMAMPSLSADGLESLRAFSLPALLVALVIHLVTSVFVGLLYAVILPMFPRRPLLLGGFIMPVLWMALLWSAMHLLNPVLQENVSWPWFLVSQIAFGVVVGAIVARSERVRTLQFEPFVERAGMEIGREVKP